MCSRRFADRVGPPLKLTVSSLMTSPRTFIVAMFTLWVLVGIFQAYLRAHHQNLAIATAASIFPFSVLLFAWCKADAARRCIKAPPAAPLLVGFFALIGVPYYFLKTMPWRRAVISIFFAFGVLVLMMVATTLTDLITYRAFAS